MNEENPERRILSETKKPEKKEKEETETFKWTPEVIKSIEDFIEHLADKYLTYKKNEAEADQSYLEAVTRHNRNMVLILSGFMVAIVLGMTYLVLSGRISGDALLFLVGTITGYVLLFIQRLILPEKNHASEEIPVG